MSEQLQASTAMSTSERTPIMCSAFSTKQILSRSVYKTERSLPSRPRKKTEVTGILIKKLNLCIAVHNQSGRKKNKLSEEEEEWIENFLERSNITYTTPGKRDTFYVGMDDGKREYKQKRYLIWKLCDLLEIINGFKIITNYHQLPMSMNSHFAKCSTSSKCIRRWLTAVTSRTFPVCVKSVKTLHF